MKKDTLHFRTIAAANLFSVEITGQLSDGAWENTRPFDHWKYWCDADVVVDGKLGHEGHPMKTNYNLKSLKKYIKEDMMNAIRITKMPWFDMSFSEFTRALTYADGIKEGCNNFYADTYFKDIDPVPENYDEDVRGRYPSIINSRVEKAMRDILDGGYSCDTSKISEKFKKAAEEEVIFQMKLRDLANYEMRQKMQRANREKLWTIGEVDKASMNEMIKNITSIPISDAELDSVLDEITGMFCHAL